MNNDKIEISDLITYGNEVFNNEEKFQKWLSKNNKSMGNVIPNDIIDTYEGRYKIMNCLHRINYGIYA